MDALTHAVEALVTPGAYNVTKKLSIGAIELIKEYLPRAVANGQDIEAREGMVNAIFLGGMSFNNAGLGYVHSMAHQLGAVYNLPHGVCCAMLLPVVERENAKRVPEAFRNVAKLWDSMWKAKQTKNVPSMLSLKLRNFLKLLVFLRNSLNSVSKKKTLTLTTFLRMP